MTRPAVLLALILLAFPLFAGVGASFAAGPAVYAYDPNRSKVSFVIESDWAAVRGELTQIEGTLRLDPEDFTRSQVELLIDLSQARFRGQSDGQVNPLQPVLQSLQPPIGRFRSSRIVRQAAGRYLIEGSFTRGRRTHQVKVPLVLLARGDDELRAQIAMRGGVEELIEDAPMLQILQGSRAGLDAVLRFGAGAPVRR